MNLKLALLLLSLLSFIVFIVFSYTVAKKYWQTTDFNTTVKLQDHISRRFDGSFSYFSLIGSAEITISLAVLISLVYLIKKRWLAFLAWLVIIPASLFEVYGKLVVFHPAPPVFLQRSELPTTLPSFYIQTNYSYPSGHLTRTIFLLTIFLVLIFLSRKSLGFKWLIGLAIIAFGFMMFMTRVYLGEHWISDVIGGSILGLSAGLLSSIFIIGHYGKMNRLPGRGEKF